MGVFVFYPSNNFGLGYKILGEKRPKFGAEGAVFKKRYLFVKLEPKWQSQLIFTFFERQKVFLEIKPIVTIFSRAYFSRPNAEFGSLYEKFRSKMQ